ncbi:MAG: tRNA (N(6)-L-threonylcarbamoyladenosine(37)-C(2))-methylthiotransferase [Candidatus Micrarchaeia archaeon]
MRIYIQTYGCTLNQADSDFIAGALEKEGHCIVSDENKAQIIILNTCTVKGATENKIMERIKSLKNRKLIIAGCLGVNEKKIRKILPNCVIVYPAGIGSIYDALKDCANKKSATYKISKDKEALPRRLTSPILRVSIQEGCIGNCYFCQTKIARPKLASYNKNRVTEWIKNGINFGAAEIQLTGMDLGAYGLECNKDLIFLLDEIERIEGNFKIRLGMINPIHTKRMIDRLIKKLKGGMLYKFIHIPVQTGSEKVCREMNRTHTVSDFNLCVKKLRKSIPQITIATDIIVGYPTENESDFKKTISMIKRIKPDIVNVSKFTPRDGTFAKNLKQLDSKIIKKRTEIIAKLCRTIAFEKNKKLIGEIYNVLITEKQKDFTGRNENYKQVIVKDFNGHLGEIVKVKIVGANHGSLVSEIMS